MFVGEVLLANDVFTARNVAEIVAANSRYRRLIVPCNRRESVVNGMGGEVMALAKANAAVPAQDGIVIARRAQLFGLLEIVHCFADPILG